MFHHPLMDDYKQALVEQLEAEIEVWGEVAELRGLPIALMKGTTKETKEMIVAGYYDDSTFDAFIAPLNTEPKTNELITYEGKTYFIKNVEALEMKSGFRITLQLAR